MSEEEKSHGELDKAKTSWQMGWITPIANLGILLGLFLVAYEIRQNSILAEATLLDSRFNFNISMDYATLGEDPMVSVVKSIEAPETMTSYDFETIARIYSGHVNSVLRLKLLGELGIVDEDQWRSFFPDENGNIPARWLLDRVGTPAGRAWLRTLLDENKSSPTELTHAIQKLIDYSSANKQHLRQNFERFLAEELEAKPVRESPALDVSNVSQ